MVILGNGDSASLAPSKLLSSEYSYFYLSCTSKNKFCDESVWMFKYIIVFAVVMFCVFFSGQ